VATVLVALLPLGLVARLARLGVGIYATALLAATLAERRHGPARAVAPLPAVLAVMHLAWGLGFLAGWARFGLRRP
jgi:hypothetical protein